MSDYQEAAVITRGRLNDNWSSTWIDWSSFNAPESTDPPTNDSWIRPIIQGGDTNRASLGPNARRRNVSVLVIQVFVPFGTGDATLRAYMDQIGDLFRDYEEGGIQFREPDLRTIGRDPEGPWYQGNVSIPFRWDRVL